MLVFYALESKGTGSFWRSPSLVVLARFMDSCRAPGPSAWSRPSGRWWPFDGGSSAVLVRLC